MRRPTNLTPAALAEWIPELAKTDRMYAFYKTPEWAHLREQVLELSHYECEDCRRKSPSVIRQATCVHHDREVKAYPELALSTYYIDEHGCWRQQLYALCAQCHNERHGRDFHGTPRETKEPLTPERW